MNIQIGSCFLNQLAIYIHHFYLVIHENFISNPKLQSLATSSREKEFVRIANYCSGEKYIIFKRIGDFWAVISNPTEGQIIYFFKQLQVFLQLLIVIISQKRNKKMSNVQNYVNLSLLLDVLVKCASQACQIIQNSSKKTTLIKQKSEQDPVTQIDHTIQKAATQIISKHFKSIKVVGEQHVDEEMIDQTLLEKINEFANSFQFQLDIDHNNFYREDDLCIFIDPLDCTRGYVCGKKWECTVLIGVSYKGAPIFGVIGQPYRRQKQNSFCYKPRIMVGGSIFYGYSAYEFEQGKWNKIQINKKQSLPKIAVSSRRTSKIQDNLISYLSASEITCGGSGNKLAMLIRGQVDAVIFIQTPTSTWDSCAGEAIILGMSGKFTKPNNTSIQYIHL